MDTEKVGSFISEQRKSQNMTQKDLALKLNISDKAISKWERGLSCPDISLLSPLAEILKISVPELLNGEKSGEDVTNAEESIATVLQLADKAVKVKAKTIQNIFAASFSLMLLIGIITCVIINFALSKTLTWSLIPIVASLFSWVVFIPTIKFGVKGIFISLLSLSVVVIPFLLVLNILIDSNSLLLPIGIRASVIGVAYFWCVFVLSKLLKRRPFLAVSVSLLLAIPASIMINYMLSGILSEPLFDIWDAMTFAILIVVAIVFFFIDFSVQKRKKS